MRTACNLLFHLGLGLSLCLSAWAEEENKAINIVDFIARNTFSDTFPSTAGYREDLTKAKLFTIDQKRGIEIANLVGDAFIELQKKGVDPNGKEFRDIVFRFSRYCLQIQGFYGTDGKEHAYVNGFKLNDTQTKLPDYIQGADDGGNDYWQCYVDLTSRTVDIVINGGFSRSPVKAQVRVGEGNPAK